MTKFNQVQDVRNIKVVVDFLPNVHKEENYHLLPTTVTFINMENQTEIETTGKMGLYEALEYAGQKVQEFNSRHEVIEVYRDEKCVQTHFYKDVI